MSIIWMSHPMHGRMPCYTSLEVDANKKNGWTVEKESPPQAQPIPAEPEEVKAHHDRMAAARAAKAAKRANDE